MSHRSPAPPQPLYEPSQASPACHLRYTWTGWPSRQTFPHTPEDLLEEIKPHWEGDGLRLLEPQWTKEKVQLLFSTTPNVSPMFLATRAKGRLDHAIRHAGLKMPLSRKLAVRSIGDNTRTDVESYISSQVRRERFIDPQFAEKMENFTVENRDVDLAQPSKSNSGRYWYNLHVVLVVAERMSIADFSDLSAICDTCEQIAGKNRYLMSRRSVMPDHLHMALRGAIAQSPNEIVYSFQNNLAYVFGRGRIWEDSFYVGTFSEYDMYAVRRRRAR